LRSGNKGVPLTTRHTLRSSLIVAEVALTVALSIGAALLLQSMIRLQHVNPGFDPENVLAIGLTLPEARYPDAASNRAFYVEAIDRVTSLSGIEAVAATNMVPQGEGLSGIAIAVEGRPPARPGEELSARFRIVSTEYFRTLAIPVIKGRAFQKADARVSVPLIRWFRQQPLPRRFTESQAPPVAVINETMAREIWPGENAIGRRFTVLFSPPITIVGIVGDARNATVGDEPVAEFYLSDLQEPQSRMALMVRARDGAGLLPAIRTQIVGIDPKLPIASARTMEEVVDSNLELHRAVSAITGGFAFIALVLMVAGVYCVISYSTAQRTQEIGIRMALGATRINIGSLVARSGIFLCFVGAGLGSVGGYALAQSASKLLYDIQPTDPSTYVTLVALVLVIASVASWIPAGRAMRVDPVAVLRNE
jgi:predicted permease